MFKCLFVILYLFFFSDFCYLSVNVTTPRPAPIPYTHNLPCKVLVASRVEPRTFVSYKYVTVELIKIISVIFLWVLILSLDITFVNVRYVHFYCDLSILPRHHEAIFVCNHTVKSWVYVCTFLSLCEPFLLIFVIDKTFLTHFPSTNTVVDFKQVPEL